MYALMLAGGTYARADETDKTRACVIMANFADTIMEARQNGITMSQLMSAMENAQLPGFDINNIIAQAFKMPLMKTADMKMQMRTEFQNEFMLQCYMAASK
jgi:GTP cyclohydrolase FolE2